MHAVLYDAKHALQAAFELNAAGATGSFCFEQSAFQVRLI